MDRLQMDTAVPTGLRLRRACAAVCAKNIALGYNDATDDFLLTCDPQAQAIWGHIADAAAGPGTREERALAAGLLRDILEDRSKLSSMSGFTDLWLQVVDAVAACQTEPIDLRTEICIVARELRSGERSHTDVANWLLDLDTRLHTPEQREDKKIVE
jgi:hypothetical protein